MKTNIAAFDEAVARWEAGDGPGAEAAFLTGLARKVRGGDQMTSATRLGYLLGGAALDTRAAWAALCQSLRIERSAWEEYVPRVEAAAEAEQYALASRDPDPGPSPELRTEDYLCTVPPLQEAVALLAAAVHRDAAPTTTRGYHR